MLELTRIIGYVQCIFKIKEGGEIIYLNKKRLREPLRHSHQHIQLEGREIFHYFREKHTYTFNPTFTRLTRLYWYKLHVQCFFRIAKESGDITSQKWEPLRHEQTFSISRNFREKVHHLPGPPEVNSMSAPMVPQYNRLFEQPGCILSWQWVVLHIVRGQKVSAHRSKWWANCLNSSWEETRSLRSWIHVYLSEWKVTR